MGRIQSNVGLITGVPIQQTVDQLMALQAVPRDRLLARQRSMQAQQAALTDLTAAVLGVQFAARRLKSVDLFQQRTVASGNASLLTGSATPTVPAGQYQFVAVRQTQTHHAISSGLAAPDEALGGGSFSFRFGGHVDQAVSLSELNTGSGVAAGKIRITDRSGASAIVDLRYAKTIDDVLAAINAADGAEVEAVTIGDSLRLIDNSGGAGNLRVQEVNGGTTAADLGLAGINVAANSVDGADLVSLFDGFDLGRLNDDNGIALLDELPDIQVTFRDNSAALSIDLNPSGDDPPHTIGDILDRLNAADPARLQASLSADGKRIELADLTTNNGGSFAVTSLLGGSAAEDLGLTGSAAGNTISGRRLVTGLKTSLLGTLAGGDGLGTLGDLDLTDRTGASATVNLAGSETLDDVIDAINSAGLAIRAQYNAARNGVVLVDSSNATASNLIAADGDATNTATKLGLAASVSADEIDSGSLSRQVVSRGTLLSSYNGGEGVGTGSFLITNSNGQSAAVNLAVLQPETIGDVIDAINSVGIGVTASINEAGDGILLTDTAGGTGLMSVADVGTGRAAKDLRLAGQATGTTIDGSTTFTIQLDAGDTLEDLVAKINALEGGTTASVFSEQSGSLRHHLSLLSGFAGKSGELLIDGSGLGLAFRDIAAAQDALLQVGAGSTFGGQLVTSPSNDFNEILPGLDVTLHGQSDDVVTLTVGQSVESVSGAIQTFVDQYNKLREKLETYTAFNESDGTKGTLFGSSETLRLDADLARLVTGQFFGVGNVRSLAELGVSIDDRGRLSFSKTKLEARYAADPEGIQEFFADETSGFGAKVDVLIETLAGPQDSALMTRVATLQRRIEDSERRVDALTARLDRNRERLLLQFFRTEEIVARMQNNLMAISQIQYIPPVQFSNQQ